MHVPSSQAETSSPLRRTRGVVRSSAHQTPLPLRYSTGGAGVPATTRRVPKHTAGQPPATAHSTAERASTSPTRQWRPAGFAKPAQPHGAGVPGAPSLPPREVSPTTPTTLPHPLPTPTTGFRFQVSGVTSR